MEQDQDIENRVVRAVDDAKKPQDDLIRLSTGVVLRGKQAPPLILMTVMAAFPRPKPPVYKSPEMGREIENADDPDYLDRVKAWQTDQSSATLNALILAGTELVSKPEGMPGPDDAVWMDEYELMGLAMRRDNASWRYLRWVQYKAATTADDIKSLMQVVGRLSGIPESAAKSAEAFPGGDKAPG